MHYPTAHRDTPAWIFFVWTSFSLALLLMTLGIWYAPVNLWIKGYLTMGLFFTVGASFTLSKTVRDNHEAQRMISRVVDAKTEQILAEYELRKPS
jgi:hypothetical protein